MVEYWSRNSLEGIDIIILIIRVQIFTEGRAIGTELCTILGIQRLTIEAGVRHIAGQLLIFHIDYERGRF